MKQICLSLKLWKWETHYLMSSGHAFLQMDFATIQNIDIFDLIVVKLLGGYIDFKMRSSILVDDVQ